MFVDVDDVVGLIARTAKYMRRYDKTSSCRKIARLAVIAIRGYVVTEDVDGCERMLRVYDAKCKAYHHANAMIDKYRAIVLRTSQDVMG